MNAVIAVVGTLIGTVLGALGSYVTQSVGHNREAKERLEAVRRQVYVEWLTRLHETYNQIRDASSRHRNGRTTAEQLIQELQRIAPEQTQSSLESVRLIAGDAVAASAANLWAHLRREPVPRARDRSSDGWRTWRDAYWGLRREFINAARADLGFKDLDWAYAGVGRNEA